MTDTTMGLPAVTDRLFFRNVITVMAVILVSGFIVQLAAGRSSFGAPLVVHAHAVAFMGWIGLTLTQAWLAAGAGLALHRRLGWISLVWVGALLILGPLVTIAAVQTARTPFFFQPQHFLIANPMTLVGFAALFGSAIALRRQSDWHMRLQVSALVMLMGPGFGRLLPMPLLSPYAFEIAGLCALAIPIVCMVRDWRVHGRAHPAWLWCIGVLLTVLLVARLAAFSPVGEAVYSALTSGSGMAGVDGLAFPPPPPGPGPG